MKLALIGNCTYSALLDNGSVVWLCWPRLDSDFAFARLVDEGKGGSFDVEGVGAATIQQQYVENTNVVRTVFTSATGAFELIDFAPRFQQYDRFFKPTMLVRIVRPLEGQPLVRIACRPVADRARRRLQALPASNHIDYVGGDALVRLTTNVPLTWVLEERPFPLLREHHLVLTWGPPLESALEETAGNFHARTADYWR